MLCIQHPKIIYDADYDVMNYSLGDTSNSYGDEDVDNIVVLKDFDTDSVTGYTVLNFKRICENKTKEYDILSRLFDIRAVMKACGL